FVCSKRAFPSKTRETRLSPTNGKLSAMNLIGNLFATDNPRTLQDQLVIITPTSAITSNRSHLGGKRRVPLAARYANMKNPSVPTSKRLANTSDCNESASPRPAGHCMNRIPELQAI